MPIAAEVLCFEDYNSVLRILDFGFRIFHTDPFGFRIVEVSDFDGGIMIIMELRV